jgi:hypothetical protein
MKIKHSKNLALIAFLLYFPLQTMAWGLIGHRVVGEIADSYLKPNTRAEIKKILGTETLAIASTWADFVRSESTFKYLNNWHYINLDRGCSYLRLQETLKKDTSTNAYTKINLLVKQLKNKDLVVDKKRLYLRMLVHLMGDIHQPLHAGNQSDKGGGEIKVTWLDKPSNLHWVWDAELIDFQQLSYSEYAKVIDVSTEAQRAAWTEGDLSNWLFDSYQVSNAIYASVKPGDKLGFKYNYDHITTVNQQLLKAGIRLAALLNQIFAS